MGPKSGHPIGAWPDLHATKGGLSNYCRVGPQYILTFIFFEKMKSMWMAYQTELQGRNVLLVPGVQKALVCGVAR